MFVTSRIRHRRTQSRKKMSRADFAAGAFLFRLYPALVARSMQPRRLAARGDLVDDAAHFARQERLLDGKPAAAAHEVAELGRECVAGDEDDSHELARPLRLDLLVQR